MTEGLRRVARVAQKRGNSAEKHEPGLVPLMGLP